MDYPKKWDKLPKHERKKNLKNLKRENKKKSELIKKIRNLVLIAVIIVIGGFGIIQLNKKSPEQTAFEQKVKSVSLKGKVKTFKIEGKKHVSVGTTVKYKTNPPTSGDHLSQAKEWGVYNHEIDDKAAVHNLEHGGIWISYKDISKEDIAILKEIGKKNSQSTVVSPRSANDDKIAVVSWGKMMRLDTVDKALIQKYINTYKNQSPEKMAK